ncbi:fibronectin type III-like domain-contianing protein [Paenarthrobacter ureafaciens]|uniref:fibronectin type III-like domain-contianing protein n=1 Tax=Paenarthrobacter ureafaciens TaxID=37931 RepID=UPI002DB9E921|nr:fibronectin type III-like domain-contianing protein [Paenarthrobacter ureafaciens]MEC3853995.1 fibronectin type III-like domain-contianing protein [Paenarthrobacter ureafaciens]
MLRSWLPAILTITTHRSTRIWTGPLFPFGYGLSHTSFEYRDLKHSPPEVSMAYLGAGTSVEVGITARNAGARAGDDVTMVFIRDGIASLAQPVRRLRGFTRTSLEPGEARSLSFELGWKDLGFWHNDGRYVVEGGSFDSCR